MSIQYEYRHITDFLDTAGFGKKLDYTNAEDQHMFGEALSQLGIIQSQRLSESGEYSGYEFVSHSITQLDGSDTFLLSTILRRPLE